MVALPDRPLLLRSHSLAISSIYPSSYPLPFSFRSRKVKARDRWFWEVLDAHEIQPAKHVVEEVFAGQGMDALFRHLELLAQQPLRQPADAPAFEFAVMRSKAGKGPAAVVARVNHAIGDGISLARLIPCVFLLLLLLCVCVRG